MKQQKRPKVVVSALIEKDGKYLLTREFLEDKKEWWLIPGGKVDWGETLEQALKREIKEEVGIDLDQVELITFHEAIWTEFDYHTVIFFYRALTNQDSQVVEETVKEAKFFSKEELKSLNLVSSAVWLFDWLEHKGVEY